MKKMRIKKLIVGLALFAALAFGFIVGEREGYIAVWREESLGRPAMMTEIQTGTLPANDRAAVRRGIYAESADEVAALLEDFDW